MRHMEICIILPRLFGVCPQTQKVYALLVKGVNLVKCGSWWGKAIRHLSRDSKVVGLIKECVERKGEKWGWVQSGEEG